MTCRYLGNEGGSSGRIILERRRNLLLGLVVPRKPVNPRLDQDETELGVLILAVGLHMFADGNRLFDEVPKVLRDGWAKSYPQTKGIIKYTRYIENGNKDGDRDREIAR